MRKYLAVVLVCVLGSAQAATVVYDESVSGDAGHDARGGTIPSLSLVTGDNLIQGSSLVEWDSGAFDLIDDWDQFDFSVGAGLQIDSISIEVTSITDFGDDLTTSYILDFNDITGGPAVLIDSISGIDSAAGPAVYNFSAGNFPKLDGSYSLDLIVDFASFNDFFIDQSEQIDYEINVSVSAVPVPAAVWLFGSALAGLGWMKRRQISQA